MITKLWRGIVLTGDSILYLLISYVITLFTVQKAIMDGFNFDIAFGLLFGLIFLACVTYHGVWGIIAKRNRENFLKPFVLFNLTPLFIGIIFAIIRLVLVT